MVLWVMKWDINPDKLDSYGAWAQGAIPSVIGAGGVVNSGAIVQSAAASAW